MIMKYKVGDIIVTAFDVNKIKTDEHDDPHAYTGWVRKIVGIVNGCYQLDEQPWFCFEEDEIEGLFDDVVKKGDIAKMKPFKTNKDSYVLPIYEEMTAISDEYVTIQLANSATFSIEENGFFYPTALIDRIFPKNKIEEFNIEEVKPNITVRDFFDVCVFNENDRIHITDSNCLFDIDITYSYDNEEDIYNILESIYDYKIIMAHRNDEELVIMIDKAEN